MREHISVYDQLSGDWVESLLFHDIISLNLEFLPKLLLTSTFSYLVIMGLTISKTLL